MIDLLPRTWRRLIRGFLAAGCLALASTRAGAADFTVTNTNDSGPGSLRNAIDQANLSTGSNTITITNLGAAGSSGNLFGELPGAIAGTVYLDANNNGSHDGGENAGRRGPLLCGGNQRTPARGTGWTIGAAARRFYIAAL